MRDRRIILMVRYKKKRFDFLKEFIPLNEWTPEDPPIIR
jgi:hypothetical protein